jgi:histone acetyltransferase (RNA polymerase elongator complex component)
MAKTVRERIIPLFLPQQGCGEPCLFCRQEWGEETAARLPGRSEVLRQAFAGLVRCPENIGAAEVAYYGGTFSALSREVQEDLLAPLGRLVAERFLAGIRISTRPDALDDDLLSLYQRHGVKTIELGVQSFDSAVLAGSGRGYDGETARRGCSLVKRAGFRLGIHLMAGLPGDSPASFAASVEAAALCAPDFVRLHPVLVFAKTGLADLWQRGEYRPPTDDEMSSWMDRPLDHLRGKGIRVARLGLYLTPAMERELLAGAREFGR